MENTLTMYWNSRTYSKRSLLYLLHTSTSFHIIAHDDALTTEP